VISCAINSIHCFSCFFMEMLYLEALTSLISWRLIDHCSSILESNQIQWQFSVSRFLFE
jgi:hypothetical protein